MHRHVDPPVQQRCLDLAREESLAFELVQRPIDLRIATGRDNDELRGDAVPRQRRPHPLSLPHGEAASPRAELERTAHPSPFPVPPSP